MEAATGSDVHSMEVNPVERIVNIIVPKAAKEIKRFLKMENYSNIVGKNKHYLKVILLLIFFSCTNRLKEQQRKVRYKRVKESVVNVSKETCAIRKIESFARFVFSQNSDSLIKNECFLKDFVVKKLVEEDEGVEWDSYDLYFEGKLVVKLENSWDDKKHISRITFVNDYFTTEKGISVNSTFKQIKKLINDTRLNESPDGFLIFYDSLMPDLAYTFEVDSNSPLFEGVTDMKKIPDTLRISSIVVFK
ncbi:hypothetical protein [Filimonas effusa]|uniref:Uncharacterized protein n=1 Tax=Filimonas effusa TaxID=2508721 RepID=A0A4Q1D0X7_9BACT|nr:hypothetical protein [Filimonas effusa]RXK81426.1 hypothetical protein ESB13_21065 [Filimonas effusa]